MEAQRELELKGIGVSPGIASGPVLRLQAEDAPLPEYAIPAEDVPREMVRLENALIETRRQLHEIQDRIDDVVRDFAFRHQDTERHADQDGQQAREQDQRQGEHQVFP